MEGADIVLKSDQENSILDVLNTVASRRSASSKVEPVDEEDLAHSQSQGRSIPESSPVGSSGSNGFIERGIQDVEGQARTIKLAFESHTGATVPSDHNIVPWIIEYAGALLNRYSVGQDGKTGYERLKGKAASMPGLEFGERVHWRSNVPAKDRKNKLDSAWKNGVFLGQRTVSGEFLVGTMEGIMRPRTVHRVPKENRWTDNLEFVTGLPWKLNKDHEPGEEVLLDTVPRAPSSHLFRQHGLR